MVVLIGTHGQITGSQRASKKVARVIGHYTAFLESNAEQGGSMAELVLDIIWMNQVKI